MEFDPVPPTYISDIDLATEMAYVAKPHYDVALVADEHNLPLTSQKMRAQGDSAARAIEAAYALKLESAPYNLAEELQQPYDYSDETILDIPLDKFSAGSLANYVASAQLAPSDTTLHQSLIARSGNISPYTASHITTSLETHGLIEKGGTERPASGMGRPITRLETTEKFDEYVTHNTSARRAIETRQLAERLNCSEGELHDRLLRMAQTVLGAAQHGDLET